VRDAAQLAALAAALVTAAASLIVALINRRATNEAAEEAKTQGEALERLKAELQAAQAERDAYNDYLFNAQKRLYTEFQPLLFQLTEACESAYNRIVGIAKAAREGKLGWFENEEYRLSTVYRLMAPVALFRLCQRRLTFVDLSVVPEISAQYATAKQLYYSWNAEIDRSAPEIRYTPHDDDADQHLQSAPQRYAWQHLPIQYVDQLSDALTVRGENGKDRCMSLGEFFQAYGRREEAIREPADAVASLFVDFHPGRKPVLWRRLVLQAHLHLALMRGVDADTKTIASGAISKDERLRFDWREADSEIALTDAVDQHFEAVGNYYLQEHPERGL
jgi:hypothetical protein